MKRLLTLALGLAAASCVCASQVTLVFNASGFQNGGVPVPGLAGPVSGSIGWDSANVADPITALNAIDLTIGGHHYTLGEVGVSGLGGGAQTLIGGLAHGINAVVGDGVFDDFMIVFDRTLPQISTFAYSIQGKAGSIWWSPTTTEAHYAAAAVPAPMSAALVGLALLGCGWKRRRAQA